MIITFRHIEVDTDLIESVFAQPPAERSKAEVRDCVNFLRYSIPEDDPNRQYLLDLRDKVKQIYNDAMDQPDEQKVVL